jgi:hypothetical protein
MSTNFQIQFKKNNGNLHIQPKGDFDGSSAWELINLIHDQYNGKGRVFIDTRNLGQIHPFGSNTFQCRLNPRAIPADRLFFKGEKGFEIAPNGSRVIVNSQKAPCRCNGNCKECTCSGKKNKCENTTNKEIG